MRIKISEEIFLSSEEADAFDKIKSILQVLSEESKDSKNKESIQNLLNDIDHFLEEIITDYY